MNQPSPVPGETFPPQAGPPRPRFSLRRVGRLFRKELSESLRDRRTLLTLVLMPILLYPLLGLVFLVYFRGALAAGHRAGYRIGFRSETEMRLLVRDLQQGEFVLLHDQGFVRPPEDPVARREQLEPHLEFLPRLEVGAFPDLEADVQAGRVDVGLRLLREKGVAQPADGGNRSSVWDALYREDSAAGREAVRYLERVVSAGGVASLGTRLRSIPGVKQDLPPIWLRPQPLANPDAEKYTVLGALLPLILVLMTITGAVYPAIDLTAGERERGTLEILMAAPVPRLSILLAKYFTVLTVALLTALVNLAMMTGTVLVLGVGPGLFSSGPRIFLVLIEVLGLLILLAAFFSAVLLTLTSMARSFKEAQAYVIPLMLVSITPGMLSLLPDLKLEGGCLAVPLLNIVLLARDLLNGAAKPLAAALVVLITALYAVTALVVAARIFGRSAVSTDAEGWLARLFRRLEGPS